MMSSDSKGSDQTAQICRLVCVFTVCISVKYYLFYLHVEILFLIPCFS